jgi:hypothetical protein
LSKKTFDEKRGNPNKRKWVHKKKTSDEKRGTNKVKKISNKNKHTPRPVSLTQWSKARVTLFDKLHKSG